MSEHLASIPPTQPRGADLKRLIEQQARNAALRAQLNRPPMLQHPPTIKHHDSAESAMQHVEQAIRQAQESGKWMAAVWSVEDGRLKLLTRTTWQFPHGDCAAAIKHLEESIESELSLPINEPLPHADLPPLPSAIGIAEPIAGEPEPPPVIDPVSVE